MRFRILELYCGAGAVKRGLEKAGFDVVGVDLHPQPRYDAPFIQADALSPWMKRFIQDFDAVWASPPCQRDTAMKHAKGAKGDAHPDLITPTRALLRGAGKPYVIENVMGAQLINPVVLNGFMFNLGARTADGTRFHLERQRKFEASFPITAPTGWEKKAPIISVLGGHVRNRAASFGGRKTADFPGEDKPRLMAEAMGLLGAGQTMNEMSQAIPPAYAEHIGWQLRRYLEGGATVRKHVDLVRERSAVGWGNG
jgi:DNA (cytosine-5)-methyltransferase 1